jgi:hypothetical protein
VRRASRSALGRRWTDRAREPDPAVPPAPSNDPPRVPRRDGRRAARLLPTRRLTPRGSAPRPSGSRAPPPVTTLGRGTVSAGRSAGPKAGSRYRRAG